MNINGTYIVGDIHGRFDEWMTMKKRIEDKDPGAKFIFTGDLVDRGPKTYEMLMWAMENISEDGKYQMVIGNHEKIKIEWWDHTKRCVEYDKKDLSDFCYIDGFLGEHYEFDKYMWDAGVNSSKMNEIINWMDALPYYKDIFVKGQRFIIVHANTLPSMFDENKNIKENLNLYQKEEIIWDRCIDGFYDVDDAILIHGHTPSVFPDAFPNEYEIEEKDLGRIVKTHNRYNVDCGAGYIGALYGADLAILRLDDFKEYYYFK